MKYREGGGQKLLSSANIWASRSTPTPDLEYSPTRFSKKLVLPCRLMIARNVRELFSFNRGISHLNEACRIDDVSRGSLSCLKSYYFAR